ncbi:type IV pilus biogenesis protein PilM [Paenibacillus sp.]|uniref:type IV pilus biogenesis protein PilM n=1 Tax=Paenibacillus sp. TaxID=58172 RepID=UPI002D6158B2|nr:pilus assembly protein PilM [Paenibacillus sp.]HZG88494.1 pilus assembly protein PilM [Paenibacillus sp.]
MLWTQAKEALLPLFHSRSLGIEITDREARWIELDRIGSGSADVVAMDTEPLLEGAVDEGRILQPQAVIQALQTLRQRTGSRTKKVHLLLPSTVTMVRFLTLPDVPAKDLKKMIDFELRFNIPLPFDKPYYDFAKLPAARTIASSPETAPAIEPNAWNLGMQEAAAASEPEDGGKPAKQCEVMIVAAPLETIEEYASVVRSAGLRPASIEIKALSLFRVAERLTPLDANATIVMIDITSTYADIGIYREGALRITRNKPIRFPDMPNKAEDADDWTRFEFQSACQDLASEVERFINFYRYSLNNRDHEVQQLLLSGEPARLGDIAAFFAERFPFETRELRFDGGLRIPAGAPNVLRFVGPLGLALRGRA